jgi:cytochrome c oxidase cbb3-type subunit I/II
MDAPRSITPRSIMPGYPDLLKQRLDFAAIQPHVDAMAMLGVPYGDAIRDAPAQARAQAARIAVEIEAQGGPAGLGDREIVALIAYLQRLGTDVKGASLAQSGPAGSGGR